MAEIEIGMGKSGRRAYGFDDIAIVPSRRTRDPEDVDISWEIDAYQFELPLMGAAMDGVVSPATAIEIGRLGGVGVLNLEGLWTRYADPEPSSTRSPSSPATRSPAACRRSTPSPSSPSWSPSASARSVTPASSPAASVTPQRTTALAPACLEAELDLLIIQGTVVSAEHVSKTVEPLNLKQFVRELDIPVIVGGCASYQAGLHLMRTGAAGVLVGVGPGHACTTRAVLGLGVPQATAIADVRAARMRHLDETGVYVHVIADGGMAPVATSPRPSCAAPTPSCSARPSLPPPRHPARDSTGAWPRSIPRCLAALGSRPRCAARCPRSSSGRPTTTTVA
jgi:IMP dehydrogenase